jgi:hypothetical protein
MVSTLDFNPGLIDDLGTDVGLTNGALSIYADQPLGRLVVDVPGYLS